VLGVSRTSAPVADTCTLPKPLLDQGREYDGLNLGARPDRFSDASRRLLWRTERPLVPYLRGRYPNSARECGAPPNLRASAAREVPEARPSCGPRLASGVRMSALPSRVHMQRQLLSLWSPVGVTVRDDVSVVARSVKGG
jgi:hypothetical protein